VKRKINALIPTLPIISFIIPLIILYTLYAYSFEQTYQGRTLHLFFIWLISLEAILSWEKLQKNKINKLWSIRTITFIIILLLPTIYVIAANYCGLNLVLENLAKQNNVGAHWARLIPLSAEYIIFAVIFCLMVILAYGVNKLTDFSIPLFFSGIIGLIFTIDNLYPYGRFTPFQAIVPTTATLAANVLNMMGFRTQLTFITSVTYGYMPYLLAWNPQNPLEIARFGIAWPCAGVESLLIFTVTIALFLRRTNISWKTGIFYFAVGAIVTYFINILRIVNIFLVSMVYGYPSPEGQKAHDFYGPLYSMVWIISYPLIIIGSRILWDKIKNRKKIQPSLSVEHG